MIVRIDASELAEVEKYLKTMPAVVSKAVKSAMGSVGFMLKQDAKKAVSSNAFGWPALSNLTLTTRAFPATPRDGFGRVSSKRIRIAKDAADYLGTSLQAIHGRMVPNWTAKNISRRIWGSIAPLIVYKYYESQFVLVFGFMEGTFGTKLSHKNAPAGANGQHGKNAGKAMRRENYIGGDVAKLARALTDGFTNVVETTSQQRYFAGLGFKFRKGTVLRIPPRPLVEPVYVANKPQIPILFGEKFRASLSRNSEKKGLGGLSFEGDAQPSVFGALP